jgi:hypothetical protein
MPAGCCLREGLWIAVRKGVLLSHKRSLASVRAERSLLYLWVGANVDKLPVAYRQLSLFLVLGIDDV